MGNLTEVRNIRMSKELVGVLEEAAACKGIELSEFVRRAAKAYVIQTMKELPNLMAPDDGRSTDVEVAEAWESAKQALRG